MAKNKKDNIDTILTDSINTTESLPVNYEALEYIGWFVVDSQNVQNLAGNLFRGGFNTNDSNLVNLLAAVNKAISETQDDIANIKTFLDQIVSKTSIDKNK